MAKQKSIDGANLQLALKQNNEKMKGYIDASHYDIKKYQKYVNTDLDYGVFEITDMTINHTTPLVFSAVISGNMELSEQGYIKLQKGKTYVFHTNLYSTAYNTGILLVDANANLLTEEVTSQNGSYIYHANEDIEVTFVTEDNGTISENLTTKWSCVNVHEINRQITIDPVEHINTTQGIEDTPVGHIIPYMGTTAPKHYLICDGTEYNLVDYPYLAQHIQDNFGTVNYFGGDGSFTFCVPDLRERFLKGSDNAGINQAAGLPNITANWKSEPSASGNGAVYITSERGTLESVSSGGSSDNRVYFDASRSNPIYGASETVIPVNTSVLYCIKYEPTYYAIVKRETTEEDITLLEQQVEELQRQNYFLQSELNNLEYIIEAINRTAIKDEPLGPEGEVVT